MAGNVEIKARARDPENLQRQAARLSDTPAELRTQVDTFFRVDRGRLKLRVEGPGRGELIYYEREDTRAPRLSNYRIHRTPDPETLKAFLAAALGVRGVVRKHRRLFLTGTSRIHLDRVEGLGDFVEIEVVLGAAQTLAEGEAIARGLMERLGIAEGDLVDTAYIDLLERRQGARICANRPAPGSGGGSRGE